MKRRSIYYLITLLCLSLNSKADTAECHYIYYTDSRVEAYPLEYVKALDHEDNAH